MITVSHAGDVGDIIYATSLIRAIASKLGDVVELVLHPGAGTRVVMTQATADSLGMLLSTQPYIGHVRYSESPEGRALDGWRQWYSGGASINLAALHFFGTEYHPSWSLLPWLTVPADVGAGPIVFARSPRYHNAMFPWRRVAEAYGADAVFVGLPEEHEAFCRDVAPVAYRRTENLLELAKVIAAAPLFVGNQSAPYAIAEALKLDTIQETWPADANCVFPRGNAIYGIDDNVPLHPLHRRNATVDLAVAVTNSPIIPGAWHAPEGTFRTR